MYIVQSESFGMFDPPVKRWGEKLLITLFLYFRFSDVAQP